MKRAVGRFVETLGFFERNPKGSISLRAVTGPGCALEDGSNIESKAISLYQAGGFARRFTALFRELHIGPNNESIFFVQALSP